MSKWPTTKLDDLCSRITVGYVGKMSDQYVDQGVAFFRSQDIKPGFIDQGNLKYISRTFHDRIIKSSLSPGDVVMVRTGYPGTAAVVPDTLLIANCSDLVIAKPGPLLDARYLAFLMNSSWGKGMVGGRLVGAAQQHFNVRVAQALEIPNPPLVIQQRIAAILGAYDDLIEVNRRRVAVLEEMARGLFEEWFVRFRFPGHEGVPIVDTQDGPLPEGWEGRAFSELADFMNGFAFKPSHFEDDGLPIIKIPELRSGISAKTPRNSGDEVPEKYRVEIGDLLFSWSGTFAISEWTEETGLLNQHLFLVRPEVGVERGFLKHGLRWAIPLFDNQGVGATMKHIRRSALDNTKVSYPPVGEVLTRANAIFRSTYEQVCNLRRANQTLAASRDLLLPRLISGQLSVEAAERQLEDAA